MKPSYRTTADDLVRTLRNLRLDVVEGAATAARKERERKPQHGARAGKTSAIREEERR